MSSEKPHSKRSLGIVVKRNKAGSYKRPKGHHMIDQSDLTDMFLPLYEYSWKGYGVNNAIFHTMKAMKFLGVSSTVTAGLQPAGGDLTTLSCLPGRQVYCEFNALPLYNLYDAATTMHADTGANANGYNGYCRSVAELAERTLMHNNFFPLNANTNDLAGQIKSSDIQNDLLKTLWKASSYDAFTSSNSAYLTNTKMLDVEFIYEGGFQSHKFTNTTSLPIYMEFEEFMPKTVLTPHVINADFGTSTTGVAARAPGLYETIYLDKFRQAQKQNGLDASKYPEQSGQYDDMHDKAFKYNRYMKLTNSRWVVGERVRHRVDPGNTFTYTMQLPSFKLKFSDVYEYKDYFSLSTNSHPTSMYGQGTTTGRINPCYFPKFSKHLCVRAYGSMSFTQGGVGSSTPGILQKDAMDDPLATNVLNIGPSDFSIQINPHSTLGVRTATHGVQLVHTMTEKHSCRLKPVCQAYHSENLNYLPNANNNNQINILDDMGFLDPTSNEQEDVEGDMDE